MKRKIKIKYLVILPILFVGFLLLMSYDWRVGVGVFLVMTAGFLLHT